MSLYFSLAVWASLALCVVYTLDGHLPQYRTDAAAVSWSPQAGVQSPGIPHAVTGTDDPTLGGSLEGVTISGTRPDHAATART